MKKKVLSLMLAGAMVLSMTACGSQNTDQGAAADTSAKAEQTDASESAPETEDQLDSTTITVFAAASLENALNEVIEKYNESQPNVTVVPSYDSSGTLMEQIEQGAACDLFFSAAQKQMDQLEADGLVVDGTRANVLNNQVVVISLKDSGTKVTGLENLKDAKSIALAGGSVPVGKYTRQALVNLGTLKADGEVDAITTDQVSQALGGVEISEEDNVSKVLTAVAEGSCEVGTTYYSDTYGYEDKLNILQVVSYDLTGDVIYPICQVQNDEADKTQTAAAKDFYKFVLSDKIKKVFDAYYFDTDVER